MLAVAAMEHVADGRHEHAVGGRSPFELRVGACAVIAFRQLLAVEVFQFEPGIQRKTERSRLNLEQKFLVLLRRKLETVFIAGFLNGPSDRAGNAQEIRCRGNVVRFLFHQLRSFAHGKRDRIVEAGQLQECARSFRGRRAAIELDFPRKR